MTPSTKRCRDCNSMFPNSELGFPILNGYLRQTCHDCSRARAKNSYDKMMKKKRMAGENSRGKRSGRFNIKKGGI